MEPPLLKLGNAEITCTCGNKLQGNPVAKYTFECIMRLQTGNACTLRASYFKLQLAEAVLGILSPFGVKEVHRKKITADGREWVDIYVMKG